LKAKRIIILGAGPAGLAAAWKLAEAGQEVVVLEKESMLGGLCRTIRYKDYLFDLGGHRFITKDEELSRQIQELMGNELLTTPRKSVIRLRGKYFQYPLEFKNLLLNMDKIFLINSLVDYVYSVTSKKLLNKKDLSFEDWVVNRFGRTLYDIYFGMYTEKLWGISPKKISADWAAQRISLLNLWDVFLRLLGKEDNQPKTYALEFAYPKMGIGRICDRMAEEIKDHGGKIYLNADVKEIVLEEEFIKKIIYQEDGRNNEISGDWYISTIPLPEFVRGIRPEADEIYLRTSDEMHFRSVKFLNLIVDTESISDNTWIYIPEKEFVFFRIQEPRNWSRFSSPEGKTSLILEIACNFNDEIWNAPDKVIFQRCVLDLKRLGLFDTSLIKDYFTTKVQHGYPIYDLNYFEKIEKTMELLRGIDNLIPIGRQGLYRYNNMDHSIKMGFLTAEHIIHGGLEARIFSIASESVAFEIERNQEKRI
jgi:protoporphyrinogen oxidase